MSDGKLADTQEHVADSSLRAIDRMRQFSSANRRSISVPEWGDLTFYFYPLRVAELSAIEDFAPKNHHERNVLMLVLKAKHEDGTAMFTSGDAFALKNEIDAAVLQRVVSFMWSTTMPKTVEEAKALIVGDPTSGSGSSLPST